MYLDGIIEALIRSSAINLVRREIDVLELSRGWSRLGWRTARYLYKRGSSGGVVGRVYRRVRADSDYNRDSVMLRMIGRDIRRHLYTDPNPVIVAHPTLVGILRGKEELLYQHGELVTPSESIVQGASYVLVPTQEAARPFREAGYAKEQVVVTGLCIEPPLLRQAADAFVARTNRYQDRGPLTGAFFSSGAEPIPHVTRLIAAAVGAVQQGMRVMLFGQDRGTFLTKAASAFSARRLDWTELHTGAGIPAELPAVVLISHQNRREENILTARLFPQFDYVVGPPHERSNWALGLGLPMFLVGPDIGPFAPLNRKMLLESGVASPLEAPIDAHLFGARVNRLRAKERLAEMAAAGWGHREINGFARIAAFLVSKYATI